LRDLKWLLGLSHKRKSKISIVRSIFVTKQSADERLENLRDQVIAQLDTLVPFLALSHEEIFDVLNAKYAEWYKDTKKTDLPETFPAYRYQVTHAAFLLGYSYVEAFVNDLIFEVYNARRDLIQDKKGEEKRKLPFEEILKLHNFEEVIQRMIESILGEMNSLEAKLNHLEKTLKWSIPEIKDLIDAHVARHALIHNGGIVNRQQPAGSRWNFQDRIQYSEVEAHMFGITARELIRRLCDQAKTICKSK
jgi:phage pi2 protein 07